MGRAYSRVTTTIVTSVEWKMLPLTGNIFEICKPLGYVSIETFTTYGTTPVQVAGQLFHTYWKSSTFAMQFWKTDCTHDFVRTQRRVSPKQVPSKSQVSPIFCGQGWEEDGREKGFRIYEISEGFGQCMDNVRERDMLEKLLVNNRATWK